MKTTIGGDRIGSGNKQNISARSYSRSTHDLSYLWRSSMASGTLVPFMNKVALPGDSWDIDLNCEVVTLPTVGPLFGSYKVQLDVYEIPMRLYNAKLHMNQLGIGMDMAEIYLPKLKLLTNNYSAYVQTFKDNEQVSPSSLMKYLGISGLGQITGSADPAYRYFNAVPLLAYWDIYKNYYANKQEEVGYVVHTDDGTVNVAQTPVQAFKLNADLEIQGTMLGSGTSQNVTFGDFIQIWYPSNASEPDHDLVMCNKGAVDTLLNVICNAGLTWDDEAKTLTGSVTGIHNTVYVKDEASVVSADLGPEVRLESFALSNIDDMRASILQYAGASFFEIDSASDMPYSASMQSYGSDATTKKYSVQFNQEGLGIKTYQSDLFNNWISTEWIDGANGVNAVTAVSTVGDSFDIDSLNLAQKVYVMLNRIAISGGSYDDWLSAVYTHERVKSIESPVYQGSLIKELSFEEVISNADTTTNPLGTLAGRGRLTGKNKGGKIRIKTNEPSVIMGLVSLTPRVDYSQGNDWSVNLETYDDFHKPALDAIGFQDLITEQMLWTDSQCNSSTGVVTTASLGKQPAWINYMTAVNKVYGNFADEDKEMFMVLNRRYEANEIDGNLEDGSTYVDPSKFNHIFAETSLDSQNFWVQISVKAEARRKMSAKVIPNL